MFERPDDLVPTPPPLPKGPVWERLLLESPLPLLLVLLASALVAFFVLRRRNRAAMATVAGASLALLAGALFLLARQVVTERERVEATVAALVDAAAKADVAHLDRLLASGAVAYTRQTPGGMSRDRILAEVRRELGERHQIKEYDIVESQASIDGPGVARSQVCVRAAEEASGWAFTSWWALDLRREASQEWMVTAIRPLHPLLAADR